MHDYQISSLEWALANWFDVKLEYNDYRPHTIYFHTNYYFFQMDQVCSNFIIFSHSLNPSCLVKVANKMIILLKIMVCQKDSPF